MKNGDPTFDEHSHRQDWRVDLSQIITPNMVMNFGYEGITDEGYLHDPYRSARYLDPTSAKGYSYEAEVTPETRRRRALGRFARCTTCRIVHRHALEYRHYTDTWGVDGMEHRGWIRPALCPTA